MNLIGEHTDYNGGAVLPMPIDRFVDVTLSSNDDARHRIASEGYEPVVRPLRFERSGEWHDYAAAAVALATADGLVAGGYDLSIRSNVPTGAGVSSSAALIVAVLKALRVERGFDATDRDLALLAQRVENEVLGVPCGIMDQMAVAVGQPGKALFLDTETLATEHLPLLDGHRFVTLHSGIERRLDEGRYAARRRECEAAAEALGVPLLCRMTASDARGIDRLNDVLARRARHQVSEHARVLRAADALRTGNAAQFGDLMNDSHASMRDDFEITHPRLDRMVEEALAQGALGSRMTGGGFGGCFVSLVRQCDVEPFVAAMSERFEEIVPVAV